LPWVGATCAAASWAGSVAVVFSAGAAVVGSGSRGAPAGCSREQAASNSVPAIARARFVAFIFVSPHPRKRGSESLAPRERQPNPTRWASTMTLQQILAFAVIAGTMALFVWGRLRYDLVAGIALLVAVLIGVVPADKAFSGFSDEIVIIVASALIVSAAVARSGIIEIAIQPIAHRITSAALQVAVLAGSVALLSAFVKNIGALAMMIPIAMQMAKRSKRSPSILLMPMAFGSLLGGTMTLIGTSPNIIVSRLRGELLGEPFGMFDFTPVGLGLTAAGLLFLVL